MGVYLVRHIETKEIFGVFWGSKAEIWDAADEVCDPFGFEYAVLHGGGAIYTHSKIGEGPKAEQWDDPENENDDESEPFNWSSFTESERFMEQLHCQSDLRWHPFDTADVGVGMLARIARRLEEEEGIPIDRDRIKQVADLVGLQTATDKN